MPHRCGLLQSSYCQESRRSSCHGRERHSSVGQCTVRRDVSSQLLVLSHQNRAFISLSVDLEISSMADATYLGQCTMFTAHSCLPQLPFPRAFPQSTPSSIACTHTTWRHPHYATRAALLPRAPAFSPKPRPYPIPIPTLSSIPTARRAPHGTYPDWFPLSQQILHPKTVIVYTNPPSQF
jgi:hypothetical protein